MDGMKGSSLGSRPTDDSRVAFEDMISDMLQIYS